MIDLAKAIKRKMFNEEIGIREVARQTTSSPSTISRITNGKNFDYLTFLKIADWLGLKVVKK